MTLKASPSYHTPINVHDIWQQYKPIRWQKSRRVGLLDGSEIDGYAEQLRNRCEMFGIKRCQNRIFRMQFENQGSVRRNGGGADGLLVDLEQRSRVTLTSLRVVVRRFRVAMRTLGVGSRRFRAQSVSLRGLGRRFRAGRGRLGNRSRRFRVATTGMALTGRHLRARTSSGVKGSRHLRAPSWNVRVQGRRFRAWRVSPGKRSRHLRATEGTLVWLGRNLRARLRHQEPQGHRFWHSNPTRSHELE